MADILLISTYELGHQPFGLASPAAWFREIGAEVDCLDLAVEPFDGHKVEEAEFIGLYLPMHTATRLAAELIPRLKSINPGAYLCCYGLYAPTNEPYLRHLGADAILGGEFETGLVEHYRQAVLGSGNTAQPVKEIKKVSLDRQKFLIPDRSGLPSLELYAHLQLPDGSERWAGYTEASRGCKHTCRHCPIVPIYNGRFRIVQQDVVLADIRQQVASGAEHITFGDPDFLNGPGHAIPLIERLHQEFPELTYDVTIKIEHLLKHARLLPVLRDTGCAFITSAVESVDDQILDRLEKGHTRADFEEVVRILQRLGIVLNPTFVAFNPWTTVEGYLEMLTVIQAMDLVGSVSPIQYAIRLLIPNQSKLLDLDEIRNLVGPFNEKSLSYPWEHPDPLVDQLYVNIFRLIQEKRSGQDSREILFEEIWQMAAEMGAESGAVNADDQGWELSATPVPRMSESWY